jgi:hypothetical protein
MCRKTCHVACAQAALFGSTPYVMFDWKPERGTTLHLVSLRTGAVTKLDAPPFFTFHYINAFESADGSTMCVDFARCACSALLSSPLQVPATAIGPASAHEHWASLQMNVEGTEGASAQLKTAFSVLSSAGAWFGRFPDPGMLNNYYLANLRSHSASVPASPLVCVPAQAPHCISPACPVPITASDARGACSGCMQAQAHQAQRAHAC